MNSLIQTRSSFGWTNRPDEEGESTEAPRSAYPGGATEANIEPARLYAIEALRRVPGFAWMNLTTLVTWSDPI